MAITNERELNEALQNGVDSIEIEGNLKDKVIRIKASGKVALDCRIWCDCNACNYRRI